MLRQPFKHRHLFVLRAGGCIALRAGAILLRRTLLEIWDPNLGSVRRKPLSCIGVGTEVSERICFDWSILAELAADQAY